MTNDEVRMTNDGKTANEVFIRHSSLVIRHSSFPYELEDDFTVARSVVEVNQDQLLPGPQQQSSLFEGNCKPGLQERGADVAVAVHIAPALVVFVWDSFWRDPVDRGAQVVNGARLVFD